MDCERHPRCEFPPCKVCLGSRFKSRTGNPHPLLQKSRCGDCILYVRGAEKDEELIRLISAIAAQLGLVIQRKRIEDELRKAYERLELRIEERTAELLKANKLLQDEIAERRQKEERLRKFSHAIEQSPSSVIITDVKGNIEYVNPKFTRLTGYTPEEIIGKNPVS